jgi:hypothetical protein
MILTGLAAVPQARADAVAYRVPTAAATVHSSATPWPTSHPRRLPTRLLINQAVNELCPSMIWQLRNSAAHYTGQPGTKARNAHDPR